MTPKVDTRGTQGRGSLQREGHMCFEEGFLSLPNWTAGSLVADGNTCRGILESHLSALTCALSPQADPKAAV